MNEKNLSVFIDFGSSKIRLGIFNQENSKKIFSLPIYPMLEEANVNKIINILNKI